MTQYRSVLQNKEAVWAERGAEIIARPSSLTGNNQRLESSKCDTVSGRTPRNEKPAFIHVREEMEGLGDWRS